MRDNHGPDEEQVSFAAICANCELGDILWIHFALLRRIRSDQLSANTSTDDVTLADIADTEHQRQMTVALAHHRILREQKRLCSLLGPGHLGENDANHERLHHHAIDRLEAHDEYRFGTFFCGGPNTVADGVLRFDGEQKARSEAVDVEHARYP